LPVTRLSTTRTRWPRRTSSSVRWDPMKPAPPVTRYDAIKNVAVSRKPNSVRLRPPYDGRGRDDHSSSPAIAGGIKRPTRRLGRAVQPAVVCWAPPYLVLLRAGFCLPPVLPRARCALTAPFHPYPSTRALSRARSGRCIFCATFLRVAPTGRYPAHCPAEFGLSSRLRASRERGRSSVVLRRSHFRTSRRTEPPHRAPHRAPSTKHRAPRGEAAPRRAGPRPIRRSPG